MSVLDAVRARWPKSAPFQLLSASRWAHQRPTFRETEPKLIAAALRRSQGQPSGNWYAFAASDRIGTARHHAAGGDRDSGAASNHGCRHDRGVNDLVGERNDLGDFL